MKDGISVSGGERSWGYKSERVEWNQIHKRNLLFSFPILQGLHTIQPKLPCHFPQPFYDSKTNGGNQ